MCQDVLSDESSGKQTDVFLIPSKLSMRDQFFFLLISNLLQTNILFKKIKNIAAMLNCYNRFPLVFSSLHGLVMNSLQTNATCRPFLCSTALQYLLADHLGF